MSQKSLNCRDIVATLDDYFGGRMNTRRRAAVDAHLSGCGRCSAYLHSYRVTVAVAKNAFSGEREAPVPEEFVGSILRKRRER